MAKKRAVLLAGLMALALSAAGCSAAPAADPSPSPQPAATAAPAPVSVSPQGLAVARQEGEVYFPSAVQWSYHFTYAYPHLLGQDYAAAAINDTYQMALDEMEQLVLPMFANEESMQFDGRNEVTHDFYVTCNNDRLLSIVQTRSQTMGSEGVALALEALVFDVSGAYIGETLTLRGCVLTGIGEEPADEMTVEKYPQAARLIEGSSDLIAEAVSRALYPSFAALQQAGVGRSDITQEDFEWEFAPAANFYVNADGNVTFFFPPAMLTEPTFDVPVFSFTAAELEALMENGES